jgi:hypothetical protein
MDDFTKDKASTTLPATAGRFSCDLIPSISFAFVLSNSSCKNSV